MIRSTAWTLFALLATGCATEPAPRALAKDNAPCAGAENPTAVVTGYWPPTNEMLRQFKSGAGWAGRNWRGLGYDVYAFFPEFPPDGDPTNDPIGAPGSVGDLETDFPVDYQETSADFWRIMEACRPTVLVTTSRGGEIGWELEALEGGHRASAASPEDPARDWISDRRGDPYPSRKTIEPRSWTAISSYRDGNTLQSRLPLEAIGQAVAEATDLSVSIDRETSGNYLSGFMGLHGLYYQSITPRTRTAGHIHVGRHVSIDEATTLFEITLQTVLERYPPSDA